MKIYKLEQSDRTGWDTYDSIIVCAENENDAKTIGPEGKPFKDEGYFGGWAISIDSIECTEIGTANENQKRGLILASFNAG